MRSWVLGWMAIAVLGAGRHGGAKRERTLDVHQWKVVRRDSGPLDYYRVVESAKGPYIHAHYMPGFETTTKAFRLPDDERHAFHALRWRWRARILPKGGNECADGKEDSAAVVYVTWKRGLKWYTLKYVWSAVGPKGAICDQKRNWFVAQDTVILESGGPLDHWVTESIDLDAQFRAHFEKGDPKADVPDLMGVAILTDGDQTHSPSSADYGDFVLSEAPSAAHPLPGATASADETRPK